MSDLCLYCSRTSPAALAASLSLQLIRLGLCWQAPEHRGRLTVVLDMDGTLLSSFTPRRAPVLPLGSIAYVVGRGGRLNPNGVFVVERPGLLAFFQRLAEFAGAP